MMQFKMRTTMTLRGVTLLLLAITCCLPLTAAVYLRGTESSYARYPLWNGCINASVSFEMKTTDEATDRETILMYTDDGGKFDFLQVSIVNGRVRAVINIVDGREAHVTLEAGRAVADGRWHRIEIRRNRMETILIVDGSATDSKFAFGSDFNFGDLTTNSPVYFGGIPREQDVDLHALALPTVVYAKRFKGHIRNVLYNNCTCQTTRASFIDGQGVTEQHSEQCDVRNPCGSCLCISTDQAQPACDCTELTCVTGSVQHYLLPMDEVVDTTIINPSGLDSKVMGNGRLVGGVQGSALRLNGRDSYVQVAGPGHRQECFGDLDKCPMGYTLATWFKMESVRDKPTVYLSNGAHSTQSHGVAMIYDGVTLEFRFRRKNGQQWRVKTTRVQPGKWYHLAATWRMQEGLSFYVNGDLVDTDISPVVRSPNEIRDDWKEFVLGRSNDDNAIIDAVIDDYPFLIDDLNFWSTLKTGREIRELGPVFCQSLPMETLRRNQLEGGKGAPGTTSGSPVLVAGKMGKALSLDGRNKYVDAGNMAGTCLADLTRCRFGVTIGLWLYFGELADNMYFFSTGSRGIRLYYQSARLMGEAQADNRFWRVSWSKAATGQWYFVELTWLAERGLQMFVDLTSVAWARNYTVREPPSEPGTGFAYLGRDNSDMGRGTRYAVATLDEVEICYGDRDQLMMMDYILRGNITHYLLPFETARDGKVWHPDLSLTLHNGANIDLGLIGDALLLDGQGKYLTVDDMEVTCIANIEVCAEGLSIKMFLKFNRLLEDSYVLSTPTYSLYWKSGRLHAYFRTSDRQWTVSTDRAQENKWQKVSLSWDNARGLRMFIDNELVATSSESTTRLAPPPTDYHVYVGRPNDDISGGKYADVLVDELEFIAAGVDYLKAYDIWHRNVTNVKLNMDSISGNVLPNANKNIRVSVSGSPKTESATYGKAITLNGRNQYIDVGRNAICQGVADACLYRGFTMRTLVRANDLRDYSYITSAAPFDVYLKDKRVVVEYRTYDHEWKVTGPEMQTDKYYMLEWSWDPENGLTLYEDGRRVATQMTGTSITSSPTGSSRTYDETRNFYIGRAQTDTINSYYSNITIDEFQAWEIKRDYLIFNNDISEDHSDLESTDRTRTTTKSPLGGDTRDPSGLRSTTTVSPIEPQGPKQLVFDGESWIVYDMSQLPDEYLQANEEESIRLKFKTTSPDGLLWYTGNEGKSMFLTLKGGQVVVVVDYANGYDTQKFRMRTQNPLTDGNWHVITVKRNGRKLITNVDGTDFPQDLRGDIKILTPTNIYIGGSEDTYTKTRKETRYNFVGTIEDIIYHGSSLPEDMDLKKDFLKDPQPPYVTEGGNVIEQDGTPWASTAIQFTRRGAYLRLPMLEGQTRNSLTLTYRTEEPHGLVLYNGGKPGSQDFVAIELFDGIPYFVIDLGDLVHRYPFTTTPTNDAKPHTLQVTRNARQLELKFDNQPSQNVKMPTVNDNLDLGTFLFLGWVNDPNRLPWHLWTRNPKSFIGCVLELQVNGQSQDLQTIARTQVMPGVETGVCTVTPHCSSPQPCVNGVTCQERWDDYVCDCAGTAFTGKNCQDNAPLVALTGNEYIRITIFPALVTHTNDITLRFKTPKPNGLLFVTSNQYVNDYLNVTLEGGRGKLQTNLGGQPKVFYFCNNLNDDKWRTIYIKRRANELEMWADGCDKTKGTIPGDGYTLDVDTIVMAATGFNMDPEQTFIGHMQNFIFDSHKFFELLAQIGALPGGITIENTGQVTTQEKLIPIHAVTLRSGTYSYVAVPPATVISGTKIEFMFKTKEPSGLLFFAGGLDGNTLAIELVNGNVHASIKDSGREQVISLATKGPVNDNAWHIVKLTRKSNYEFEIGVDNVTSGMSVSAGTSRFDLSGSLYFGGVPEARYSTLPAVITSNSNFAGCLASVKVNTNLYKLINQVDISQYVTAGCTDASRFCFPRSPCEHFGVCREGLTDFICDCNMTSFAGKTCNDEAEGFLYGNASSSGIYIYNFVPPIDSTMDRIAVGFMTRQSNGTLVRLDSGQAADFIELRLVNGFVEAIWNVDDEGQGQQRLIVNNKKYNDGQYHYVTFVRSNTNSTLRVDDFPPASVRFQDNYVRNFDSVAQMKVGGNMDSKENIYYPFKGIISGVYYNGYRVFELVDNIYMKHDIHRASHRFKLPDDIVPTDKPVGPVAPTSKPGPNPGPDPITPAPTPGPTPVVTPSQPIQPSDKPTQPSSGGDPTTTPAGGKPVATPLPPLPVAAAGVGGGLFGGGSGGEGARAGAAAGALLGLLLAASSVMWAVYKFKPGLLGSGAAAKPISISSPTSNLPLKRALEASAVQESRPLLLTPPRVAPPSSVSASYQTTMDGARMASLTDYFTYISGGTVNMAGTAVSAAASAPGGYSRAVQTDLAFGGAGSGYGATAHLSNGSATLSPNGTLSAAGRSPGGYMAGAGAPRSPGRRPGPNDFNPPYVGMEDEPPVSAPPPRSPAAQQKPEEPLLTPSRAPNQRNDMPPPNALMDEDEPLLAPSRAPNTRSPYQGPNPAAYTDVDQQMMANNNRYNQTSSSSGYRSNVTNVTNIVNETTVIRQQQQQNQHLQQNGGYSTRSMTSEGTQTISRGQNDGGYEHVSYVDGNIMVSSNSQQQLSSGARGGYRDGYVSEDETRRAAAYRQQGRQDGALSSQASVDSQFSSYRIKNTSLLTTMTYGMEDRRESLGGPNLLAAEEIRVDCIVLTTDGRYVVTGSIFGPPQVWDLETGDLVRIMEGETLSTTDLHLAANDTLLVGQVAEAVRVHAGDVDTINRRSHHRKLQIWDFVSGHPLEMRSELCTASCLMPDGERLVLGKTDAGSQRTSLTIWDVLGNEALRRFTFDASLGFVDSLAFLDVSTDGRYVIAGYQNSYDGNANYVIYDMTVSAYTPERAPPAVITFDAKAECAAVLNHEEVVTGTVRGELFIWNIRTAKAQRQLLPPAQASGPPGTPTSRPGLFVPSSAHQREIKALAVSRDRQYLVSASADNLLRVWSVANEAVVSVLRGHTDEVWCCAVSEDSDMVASGSRDGTIRLWRLHSGQQLCLFNTGVDIFTLKISADKRTLVALGDKYGARKIIMLRVVHTKTKSAGGSRATSPL